MSTRIEAKTKPWRTLICKNTTVCTKIEGKLKNLSNINIEWRVQIEMGELWEAELFFRNVKKLAIAINQVSKTGQRSISCKYNKSLEQTHQKVFNQLIMLPPFEMLSRINGVRGVYRLKVIIHTEKSLPCRLWLLSVNNKQEHRFSWHWISKIIRRGSICI